MGLRFPQVETSMKPKTIKVSEVQIQKAADDFLELDGWRYVETDPKHLRGLGVSEKGIPDRLYLRYGFNPKTMYGSIPAKSTTQILWVEHKRKKGKAAQHQKDWHETERARGALVLVAGIDFEASLEGFVEWYEKSGLQRKKVTLGIRARAS